MAINVDFYSFAKKHNSTAVPSSAPLTFACELKEGCSIIYPIIGLSNGSAWNPASYNYARITAFNRYYYVTDWSYEGGLWWATLNIDALATWRTEIYSTSAYVERASKEFNGKIIDTSYPASIGYSVSRSVWSGNTPWVSELANGVYIVGIINNDSDAIGAVSYYAFTPSQFANFKSYLLGSIDWLGESEDVTENTFKALFNPFQYIVSVKWFPFAYTSIAGKTLINIIKIGWWEIENVECYTFNVSVVPITNLLTIWEHGLAGFRGSYLNSAPYSIYRLFAPPFGIFDLDPAMMANVKYDNVTGSAPLHIQIRIDLISGKACLEVSILPDYVAASTNLILQIETQLSIDIQLAQIYSQTGLGEITNSVVQSMSALTTTLKTGKSLNDPIEGSRVANISIGDAIAIGSVNLSQIGNNGSLSQFYLPFFVYTINRQMVEDDPDDKGRPLCRLVNELSYLAPGYVITSDAHVIMTGTDSEISEVNDALNGGIFLE